MFLFTFHSGLELKNVVLGWVYVALGFGTRIQRFCGSEAVQTNGPFELVHLDGTSVWK